MPFSGTLFLAICSIFGQGRLKIWTSNSFFAIYNRGPLLKHEYLKMDKDKDVCFLVLMKIWDIVIIGP